MPWLKKAQGGWSPADRPDVLLSDAEAIDAVKQGRNEDGDEVKFAPGEMWPEGYDPEARDTFPAAPRGEISRMADPSETLKSEDIEKAGLALRGRMADVDPSYGAHHRIRFAPTPPGVRPEDQMHLEGQAIQAVKQAEGLAPKKALALKLALASKGHSQFWAPSVAPPTDEAQPERLALGGGPGGPLGNFFAMVKGAARPGTPDGAMTPEQRKDMAMELALQSRDARRIGASAQGLLAAAAGGLRGRPADYSQANRARALADQPVHDLIEERERGTAEEDRNRKLAAMKADMDPASPQSQTFRGMLEEALPNIRAKIPGFETMSASQLERFRPMVEKLSELQGKKANAEAEAKWRERTLSETERYHREMAEAAKLRARRTGGGRGGPGQHAKGTVISNYDILPDAEPTADDAKKLKASIAAAERMGQHIQELRKLHHDYGTEWGGEAGNRMQQLQTAIKLEGKNIAELGALSGPDEHLMEELTQASPGDLWTNIKAKATLGAVDNTATALDGVEKWVNDAVNGNAKTYGYRKRPGAGPAQGPAAAAPPPQETVIKGKRYVERNGEWFEVQG